MRSVAAFGWELGRRHRWGWIALGMWLSALALVRLVAFRAGDEFGATGGSGFAFRIVLPGGIALFWLIAVFTFGSGGPVTGRRSIFPARLFTLPVTSGALAAWPMLAAALTVTLLWSAVRALPPWPASLRADVPYLWPGLLAVALVAWTQAIMWATYPLPGLRVLVGVLWLSAVQAGAILAVESRVGEPLMLGILAPQLPLAYGLARRAVARARRGEAADWSTWLAPLKRVGRRRAARRPFRNAAAAQLWLEWRRAGRSLPLMVGILLPVESLLLWASRGAPALVITLLVIVAVTPPAMASFTALAVRKSGPGDEPGLSPFTATRPVTSAALVDARLRMAARSTALAWLLVVAGAPAALVASDTWSVVAERAHQFAAVVGTGRALVAGGLVLSLLVLTTWRQMVQSLYIGLTGRPALIKGSAFATLCLVVVIGPLLDWAWSGSARAWLWVALYWTLGVVIAARALLACWIATRLHRDGLVSERALVTGAARWLSGVAAVYLVLLWWFSTPHAPRFLLLMLAIVAVPLVRLWAAPLALAWNRHR